MGASQEEEEEELVKRVEVRRIRREYKVSWEPRKWRVSSTVDLMRSNVFHHLGILLGLDLEVYTLPRFISLKYRAQEQFKPQGWLCKYLCFSIEYTALERYRLIQLTKDQMIQLIYVNVKLYCL